MHVISTAITLSGSGQICRQISSKYLVLAGFQKLESGTSLLQTAHIDNQTESTLQQLQKSF